MRALLAFVLLAVLGLVAWWGLSDRAKVPPRPEDRRSVDTGSGAPAPIEAGPRNPSGLAPMPRPARVSVAELLAQGKVGNGSLLVALAPAAGMDAPKGVRVDVEALDIPAAIHPLALPQDDGAWLFERVPIGRWRVRAYVTGALDATALVTVAPGALAEVTIPLVPGADAAWKVTVAGDEPPEVVHVALLDGRGVPIEATYQTAYTTLHAAAGKVPVLPLEGRVVGLSPGSYRLRAWLPGSEGDADEKPVTVRAGEHPVVELRLVKR